MHIASIYIIVCRYIHKLMSFSQAETTERHLLRSLHTPDTPLASSTFIHLIIHARLLRLLRTWPFKNLTNKVNVGMPF